MPHVAGGRTHAVSRIESIESLFEQLDELSDDEMDDLLYTRAHHEVRCNRKEPGPYARAFSLAEGDDAKANARYIELRVEALNREYRDWQADSDKNEEKQRLEAEQDAQTTLMSVALLVIVLLLVILVF